jgi:hypothetical protein
VGRHSTYIAAVTSCLLTFLTIRALGGDALRLLTNRVAVRILRELDAHPIGCVALLRVLFQTVPALNYALAMSGIRLRSYLIGYARGPPGANRLVLRLFRRAGDRTARSLRVSACSLNPGGVPIDPGGLSPSRDSLGALGLAAAQALPQTQVAQRSSPGRAALPRCAAPTGKPSSPGGSRKLTLVHRTLTPSTQETVAIQRLAIQARVVLPRRLVGAFVSLAGGGDQRVARLPALTTTTDRARASRPQTKTAPKGGCFGAPESHRTRYAGRFAVSRHSTGVLHRV